MRETRDGLLKRVDPLKLFLLAEAISVRKGSACASDATADRLADAAEVMHALATQLATVTAEREALRRECGGEHPPEGETWPEVARDADRDWHELDATTKARIAALEALLNAWSGTQADMADYLKAHGWTQDRARYLGWLWRREGVPGAMETTGAMAHETRRLLSPEPAQDMEVRP